MRKNRFLYPVLFLLVFSEEFFSQKIEKIKFQKDPTLIYFFQKGVKGDTLSRKNENLFYLVTSDSLKRDILVEVENGQLMATTNDSLFKLNYIPGVKYESFYIKRLDPGDPLVFEKRFDYQTLVNGVSELTKERIRIVLRHKISGQIILENKFFVN